MKKIWIVLVVMAFGLAACATPTNNAEQGTAVGVGVGAVTGAILGQAIGGSTGATVLGAVAGAAAGGIAGHMIGEYMDNQEREMHAALATSEGAIVERQQDGIFITLRSDVLFDVDSARLKEGAYDEIDHVARVLVRYPDTHVTVTGHTDSTGSESHNLDLSEQRAYAVADVLIEDGVQQGRIATRGFGEEQPIASNATEAGRQLNRRVTLEVLPVQK